MSEKEWIEYIIYERMELHWQELSHSKADGRQEESQMLDRVEAILKRLTKKERKTINRFFDLTTGEYESFSVNSYQAVGLL